MKNHAHFISIYDFLCNQVEITDIAWLVNEAVWWRDDLGVYREATSDEKDLISVDLSRHLKNQPINGEAQTDEQQKCVTELFNWEEGGSGIEKMVLAHAGWPVDKIDVKGLTLIESKNTPNNSEYSLSTKEYISLEKLVLGMAMAKYQYKPEAKNNSCTGNKKDSIADDLSHYDLRLPQKTGHQKN